MQQQPPFLVNFLSWGGRLVPVPRELWYLFVPRADALLMLEFASKLDPNAQLFDVLDPRAALPIQISRPQFQVQPMNPMQATDISIYVILGNVPLKGSGGRTALLCENAGWLADTHAGMYDSLDAEATDIQGNRNQRSALYAYVSPNDPADSDCYWADSPALGGLAADPLPGLVVTPAEPVKMAQAGRH